MNKITIIIAFMALGISACNTVGGLGRDISEAGDSLDQAAGWSQDQINDASHWVDETASPEPDYY